MPAPAPPGGPWGVRPHSGQQPPEQEGGSGGGRRSTEGPEPRVPGPAAYLGEEQQLHHGVDAPEEAHEGVTVRGLQPPGPQGAVLGHADGGPQKQAAAVQAGRPEVQLTESKMLKWRMSSSRLRSTVAEDVDGRGHAGVNS